MNTTFIQHVLYTFKQDYSVSLELYTRVGSAVNLETGVKTLTKLVFKIDRAVLLPRQVVRTALMLPGSGDTFKYGGLIDQGKRIVIIDINDYPSTYEVRPNDYVVINTQRYNIKDATLHDDRTAVLLTLEETIGEQPARIITENLIEELHLQSRARNVP